MGNPTLNSSSYFDMGSCFITGTGFAVVPEPGTLGLAVFGMVVIGLRRRRSVLRGIRVTPRSKN